MPEKKIRQPFENSLVGGFVMTHEKDKAYPLRVEVPPADELLRPDADEAATRLAEGPSGSGRGKWPKGRKRRTKLAVLGIPARALEAGDPAYARCVRLASAYRKTRTRELAVCHGYVSSGASALLASASMALAASRYLYEQAATSGENQFEQLKIASRLADSARQNELAAWELCAREAVAKKKMAFATQGTPWLVVDDDTKGKPGPKRPEPDLILPPVGTSLEGFIQSATLEERKEEKNGGR